MSKIMNDNFQINVGNPIDAKYLNSSNQPYANASAVNTAIAQSQRYIGLTVNVGNIEYWYCAGVLDTNLVIKDSGIVNTGLTNASNGLSKIGNTVILGGPLTGNTDICGESNALNLGTLSSNLGTFQVNSATISLKSTGTTEVCADTTLVLDGICIYLNSPATYDDNYHSSYSQYSVPDVGWITGCTASMLTTIANKLDTSVFNGYTATTNNTLTATTQITNVAITGVTNGLTKVGSHDACLGGTLNSNTTLSGSQLLTLGDLNGICLSTNNTTDIALNAKVNGGIYLKSQGGSVASSSDNANAVSIALDYNAAVGMLVTDNRATPRGLEYASNYLNTFNDNSLITKYYVDSVATGLNIHTAVVVATTTDISLSGLTTVDGITLETGNRVLVKDQTDGALNGIYTASTTTWGRSEDYNFEPSGEISNGDLIPVISGDTNSNSQWVLVSQNPIDSGDTLTYTSFSRQQGVVAGNGICTGTIGSSTQVCVKLSPTNSGLCFNATALELDYETFRYGLTCSVTTGKIDVCADYGAATGTEIPVRIDTGATGKLYVDSAAIITGLDTPIINADNGLTKQGNVVVLGGSLTGDTTINGVSYTHNLNLTQLNSFTLGFNGDSIVTDSNTTPRGLQYAEDYGDTFIDNSLVTKKFVLTNISGNTLQNVTTFGNTTTNSVIIGNGGSTATGATSFANGENVTAIGNYSHAEGNNTCAIGVSSHSEGFCNIASGYSSHAEGNGSCTIGVFSHAEGECTIAYGYFSHSEGYHVTASGYSSHAEGSCNNAMGAFSHAEGSDGCAIGEFSHTEGEGPITIGTHSHAEGTYTSAIGQYSHSEGDSTVASGVSSHAEGRESCAMGFGSHGEGFQTKAYGTSSHAEGRITTTIGQYSHSEGFGSCTIGTYSHAEGQCTLSCGLYSHASGRYNIGKTDTISEIGVGTGTTARCNAFEVYCNGTIGIPLLLDKTTETCVLYVNSDGYLSKGVVSGGVDTLQQVTDSGNTTTNSVIIGNSGSTATGTTSFANGCNVSADGGYSHAEGEFSIASGLGSHAEGYISYAIGSYSHAEGGSSCTIGDYSHSEGETTVASGYSSHAEGNASCSIGDYSHAEGTTSNAIGEYSHAEGESTSSIGYGSHAEGSYNISCGNYSHAEGESAIASGTSSHAEGYYSCAIGDYSHAEGDSTIASGLGSHAEGIGVNAIGNYSHAEGESSISIGENSHAEGLCNIASGYSSHAEGQSNCTFGLYSHSEGFGSCTIGNYSHAEGYCNIAIGHGSHVSGRYNIGRSDTISEIGAGAVAARCNAFEVYCNGNIALPLISGDTSSGCAVYIGTGGQLTYGSISSAISVSNGISTNGSYFVLGGNLTGDTTIDLNNNSLKLIDSSSLFEFSGNTLKTTNINTSGLTFINGNQGVNKILISDSGGTINYSSDYVNKTSSESISGLKTFNDGIDIIWKTIYIDSAATGGTNNGSSWANAYTDLKNGIESVSAYTRIFIANQKYILTGSTGITVNNNYIEIYGYNLYSTNINENPLISGGDSLPYFNGSSNIILANSNNFKINNISFINFSANTTNISIIRINGNNIDINNLNFNDCWLGNGSSCLRIGNNSSFININNINLNNIIGNIGATACFIFQEVSEMFMKNITINNSALLNDASSTYFNIAGCKNLYCENIYGINLGLSYTGSTNVGSFIVVTYLSSTSAKSTNIIFNRIKVSNSFIKSGYLIYRGSQIVILNNEFSNNLFNGPYGIFYNAFASTMYNNVVLYNCTTYNNDNIAWTFGGSSDSNVSGNSITAYNCIFQDTNVASSNVTNLLHLRNSYLKTDISSTHDVVDCEYGSDAGFISNDNLKLKNTSINYNKGVLYDNLIKYLQHGNNTDILNIAYNYNLIHRGAYQDIVYYEPSNEMRIYNLTGLTYTATTSSEFIGASGGSTIYLPNVPSNGQKITISDITGDALTNNITICSNTLNIIGSQDALINTNYGSLTLVNNINFWSAISFIP
jgi:hypothetical protein